MMNDLKSGLNPNELVRHLQKPASEFRREDLVDFIQASEIGSKAGDSYQDIHKNEEKYAHLKHLPASCHESAAAILKRRDIFEKDGVFPDGMIDNIIARLRSYNDENLSERLFGNKEAIRDLVLKYIHVK